MLSYKIKKALFPKVIQSRNLFPVSDPLEIIPLIRWRKMKILGGLKPVYCFHMKCSGRCAAWGKPRQEFWCLKRNHGYVELS